MKDPSLKGLIPSQYLEERRKAFVAPENDFAKTSRKKRSTRKSDVHSFVRFSVVCGLIDRRKKKRMLFNVKDSSMFDKGDICLYQEVARMPPFARKCLILIGAKGVGRRTLKTRLIALDPKRFGTTKPRKTPRLDRRLAQSLASRSFRHVTTAARHRGSERLSADGTRRNGR